MGFFSFLTENSKNGRSISNLYSKREAFTVYLYSPVGVWKEDNYEGYGVFGGKDIFELLAELNGKETREQGIDLYYGGKVEVWPILSEKVLDPKELNFDTPLVDCPYQGYFYDGEE